MIYSTIWKSVLYDLIGNDEMNSGFNCNKIYDKKLHIPITI